MVLRSLFGPTRIDCAGNTYVPYPIRGRRGGLAAKVAQYSIVTLGSSGPAVTLTLELEHGPNGQAYVQHSIPINNVAPGTTYPALLVGDANPSIILGDWLRPIVKIKDGTGNQPQWAFIEVYEMLKPF